MSRRSRAQRALLFVRVGLVALSTALFGSVSFATPSSAASAPSVVSPPSSSAVQSSVHLTSLPRGLTPSLSSFASAQVGGPLWAPFAVKRCDASSPTVAAKPAPCLLGDVSSKRTIALVGDSNAGNYAAALGNGLRPLGYRVAVFLYSSCLVSDLHYTFIPFGGAPASQCNLWHSRVPAAIASVHPIAMVLVSGPTGTLINASTWAKGIQTFYDKVNALSPKTKRVLMGTSPAFPVAPPICLSRHPNPQSCSVRFSSDHAYYQKLLARDVSVAQTSHATLIQAFRWFCWKQTCSPVIGKYLAYADQDHLTPQFATSIAPQISASVLAALELKARR